MKYKNHNLTWLFAIMLMVIILSLPGCGKKDKKDETQTKTEVTTDDVKTEEMEESLEEASQKAFRADMDVLLGAGESGNVEECDKIENENLKASCVVTATITKAKDTRDQSLCESIAQARSKELCIKKATEVEEVEE